VSEILWDEGNKTHATRHGVSALEIQEVFERKHAFQFRDAEDEEDQFRAYGTTRNRRYVTVAFSIRNEKIRPISAWDMERKELEVYASEIHE